MKGSTVAEPWDAMDGGGGKTQSHVGVSLASGAGEPSTSAVPATTTTTEERRGPRLTRTDSEKRQRKGEKNEPSKDKEKAKAVEYYDYGSLKVMDALDTPVWLFDPRSKKNLWGNEAALRLHGRPRMEDFLRLDLARGGEGDACKVFCEAAARALVEPDRRRIQCRLPGLDLASPNARHLFTVSFRRVGLKTGVTSIPCCLVTAESSLFNSMHQSLRALEMLRSSPIFTFLFTHAGKLLCANPCAVTFYEKYFDPHKQQEGNRAGGGASGSGSGSHHTKKVEDRGTEESPQTDTFGLTLQNILSVGDWDETVTYPDDNGPTLDPQITLREHKTAKVIKHIQHILFVEKFESFRIQMKMPKRRDPRKHRWVEFEMWAAKDPVTQTEAILVNQTNMQETKKLELELKGKHDFLKTRNIELQVELKRAKDKENPKVGLDLDSTVDKTIHLLDEIMSGRQPAKEDVQKLKQALRTRDLRAPNRLEEMLLSNKKGFEGEVGLSLFEMLNPNTQASGSAQPLSARENNNVKRSLSRNSTMEVDEEEEGQHGDHDHSQAPPIPKRVDSSKAVLQVLETADGWFFDAFRLEEVSHGRPLSVLSCHLFKRLNLFETFNINEAQFAHFMLKIEAGYPNNAYHNRVHVANVLQSTYVLLTKGLGPTIAGDQEILAGLLAAIIHDYEHKGVNNDFLVRFQDDLALKYNDRSPLENHHISAAFDVMLRKPYDIFANTEVELFIKLRKAVIAMVLATDMKIHFDVLGRFRLIEKKLARLNGGGAPEGPEELLKEREVPGSEGSPAAAPGGAEGGGQEDELLPEDVSLSLQVCLKCADIGHVYCDSNVHLRWVQKLEQEFFAQGDKEEEQGAISKSPLMDREKAGITKSQVGFFKIVVVPLFASFCTAFPSAEPMLDSLNRNLKLWAKIEEEQLEISEVFVEDRGETVDMERG